MNNPNQLKEANNGGLLSQLIKEPLIQFAVIGAALFAAYTFINDTKDEIEPDKIVIGARQIENLENTFERAWLRKPTKVEIDGLIESHLKEEVLYREALKLGLDQNDTVIRRHLGQKMSFLSKDLTEPPAATDEVLQKYLDAHKEQFQNPPKATFTQLYFKLDKTKTTGDRIKLALKNLMGRVPTKEILESVGDPTMLPGSMSEATPRDIAKVFGQGFAKSLLDLPAKKWVGPVQSGFGMHLVYIEDQVSAAPPTLKEVRKVVEREWRAQEQKVANDRFFQLLKDRYEIEILPSNSDKS